MELAETDLDGAEATRPAPRPSSADRGPTRGRGNAAAPSCEAQAAARRYLEVWDLAQAEISRLGPGFRGG